MASVGGCHSPGGAALSDISLAFRLTRTALFGTTTLPKLFAGYFEPRASSFATARWRPSLAHRITHGYAIPFDDDGGTPAWHARLASRTTIPSLAVLARPWRTTAPPGVHGSGVLAGLDVLSRRHGTTERCHRAGRHSGPCSPYTTAHGHGTWCRAVARCGGWASRTGVGCVRASGVGAGGGGVMARAITRPASCQQ